jgi:serine/threonine-protein kinase
LLGEIACGGMGVVYRAWDRQVGRVVALKMIRAGVLARPEEVERFCREIAAVVRLDHPHVIQVYDVGQIDGCPYFTMQLACGGSLDRHPARPFAEARAAALVEKVARAVEHAHRRGILHRDLKPANVLLGGDDEPLVADFGLAKFLDAGPEGLTRTGVTPGTPAYMAPEQAAGRSQDIGPRTDVWALGVILYELLTGRRPVTGGNREETLYHILTEVPPRPRALRPDLDPALEAIVLRCLEKDPAGRYASAGDLADDLALWLRGTPRRPPPGGRVRRRRAAAALVLGLAAALGLAWAAGLLRHPAPAPAAPRDAPVVLIGDTDPPPALRWVLGEDDAVLDPAGEGLSLRTPTTAQVELLAEPPWPAYRLEAEVQDVGLAHGTAGLYFGHGRHPSARGPCQLSLAVGFADHGTRGGFLTVRLWHVAEADPSHPAVARLCKDHDFEAARSGPAPWRALAVEVTPDEVRLFFDGRHVRSVSAREIAKQGAPLFEDAPGLSWQSVPRGGLGVYIDDNGAAVLRRVVLRPLGEARE